MHALRRNHMQALRAKDVRIDTDSLLDRFVRYAKIHTTSDENSSTCPSTERQFDLGRLLVEELRAMGLEAEVDEHCYVYARVPARGADAQAPAIGLIAHMDTSQDAPGENVRPIVHENYQGGEIVLPGDPTQKITPEDNPDLENQRGKDIITSDGTTLLGADDKAGVAEIMEALRTLHENPAIPHPPIAVAFTPDEEVGRGVDRFDVERFGARIAYTIDGSEVGRIENETFNAHSATFRLRGFNVHPGTAKGRMVNTLYAAAEIIRRLPEDMRPETTEGRQGYLHPRLIEGTVDSCTIALLVRDFDIEGSNEKIRLLERIRDEVKASYPKVEIELETKTRYLNMRPKLDENPRVVEMALEATRAIGIEPRLEVIRGGTDGARLSYMGVLTPNIFTGGHNYHSVREWISLQDMETSVRVILALLELWSHA